MMGCCASAAARATDGPKGEVKAMKCFALSGFHYLYIVKFINRKTIQYGAYTFT